jgi:hypothetical protein
VSEGEEVGNLRTLTGAMLSGGCRRRVQSVRERKKLTNMPLAACKSSRGYVPYRVLSRNAFASIHPEDLAGKLVEGVGRTSPHNHCKSLS